jgi:hypothetical protein
MAKAFMPKIVSANALLEGDVVYLDGGGGWTRRLANAAIARDEDAARALLAAADQPAAVVGPYLTDVAIEPDGPRPTHFREVYRSRGPSFRNDLGPQARQSDGG